MPIATRIFASLLTISFFATSIPASQAQSPAPIAGRLISEPDMPIAPGAQHKSGLISEHRLTTREKNLIFTSIYRPSRGEFPRIEMVYSRAEPGFDFPRPPAPARLMDLFDFLKGRSNQLDLPRTTQTRWGPMRYQAFRSNGIPCVAHTAHWSGGTLGGGSQLLGYYCADPTTLFADAEITQYLRDLDIREALPVKVTIENTNNKLPIRLHWPTAETPTGQGVLLLERTGGGTMMFEMGATRCEGYWAHEAGAYGEVDPPSGSWRVYCSDGKSVTGTYFSTDPRTAQGTGYDDAGGAVFFELDLP